MSDTHRFTVVASSASSLLDVAPVHVLHHLASFLDLAALCALAGTCRAGLCAAEDELRGVREACAQLVRRYPVAYDTLMSRVSHRRRRRMPSASRMAALCSRWGVRIGRSPCDALLAHLDGAFRVSADHTVYHVEGQYSTHRWTIDPPHRPHRNAGSSGQAWAWSGLDDAVSVFRPGDAIRVRMTGRAPAAAQSSAADTDGIHADADATFLLPDAPSFTLGAKGNGTLMVRIHLEATSAAPTDRALAASLIFDVEPPPGMDADVLGDRAAFRAALDYVCPRLGLAPTQPDGLCGNDTKRWSWDAVTADAVRARMQRDGFPATRLQVEEVFPRQYVCDTS